MQQAESTSVASQGRAPDDQAGAVGLLEKALEELTAQYERLKALAQLRLEAIRRANSEALSACIAQENEAVAAVAEIEKQRVRAVGDLATRLGSPEGVGTSVRWIAERVEAAAAERLLERAQRLRELLLDVREQNRVASIVAERVARHMEGLWAQVAVALNHSKTYGRMGAVAPGPQVVSALDLTS